VFQMRAALKSRLASLIINDGRIKNGRTLSRVVMSLTNILVRHALVRNTFNCPYGWCEWEQLGIINGSLGDKRTNVESLIADRGQEGVQGGLQRPRTLGVGSLQVRQVLPRDEVPVPGGVPR
jgi:hypothetical protein